MKYVDGYVFPISKRKLPAYRKMARAGRRLWMKHGALDYVESVGDDLTPQWGALFPKMTKLKKGETVVFSYIVFRSRAHRDRVNKKVMEEAEAMAEMFGDPPFDMKRVAYGGFSTFIGG